MKTAMKFVCLALAVILFSHGGAFAADSPNGFDPNRYVVKDGLLFLDDKQFYGAEVVTVQTARGTIYWLAGDPEADGTNRGLYRGWKSGIYFFGQDGKFISMLEKERAQMCFVRFSPDGEQFTIGIFGDSEYLLYNFDTLELIENSAE